MDAVLLLIQAGLIFGVAFIYANLGLGGGLLFVPILLSTGVPDKDLAVPISLTLTIATATSSVINHHRRGMFTQMAQKTAAQFEQDGPMSLEVAQRPCERRRHADRERNRLRAGTLTLLLMAAEKKRPWEVFIAASLALVAVSAIGVIVGSVLSHYLPLDWIKRAAGAAFIVIGVLVLFGKF